MLTSIFEAVPYALALAFCSAVLLWVIPGACLAAAAAWRNPQHRLARETRRRRAHSLADTDASMWPRFSGPA